MARILRIYVYVWENWKQSDIPKNSKNSSGASRSIVNTKLFVNVDECY